MLDNNQPHESRPEVGGVTYSPGLYKIPMVRMCGSTDENRECTGLKVGHIEMYGGVNSPSVWFRAIPHRKVGAILPEVI